MSSLINAYSMARKEIHNWLDNQRIPWNDNIVGRIGEFYATDFLKTYQLNGVVPASKSNQKGYDFCVGEKRYSVKTITKENKTGSTSPITLDDGWDYLVAVKLDKDFNLEALSLIDYKSLKKSLDDNSKRQGKVPGVKKSFRWWQILNQPPHKKI